MVRFALQEAGRFALGLFGAGLAACAISALSLAGASHGPKAFLGAVATKLLAFAELDFGVSAISGLPVLEELARHLPPTMALVLAGAVIAFALGTPLGLLFGAGPLRRAGAPLIQLVAAAPLFCAGLALAFLAQHLLHWPVSVNGPVQIVSPFAHDADFRIVALPALTIGAAGAAAVQLALRRAAAAAAFEPYRVGLRRMGLSVAEIERSYVAPQIFAGLCLGLGEVMLALLSAAAVAEWVFHYPGAADLFVKSVALRDWNLAALVLFLFACAVFLADFAGRLAARALVPEGAEP